MKKGNKSGPFRFAVALSFPGEKRDDVRKVDQALSKLLKPEEKIFFDERFEHEIAGFDADTVLQKIYHDQSELIVVFLCKEYEQKEWCCNVEWRAIRDLIKKRRGPSVLPLRFDTAEIPGVYSIDIIPDISNRSPEETAQLILDRLQFLRGIPPDPPPAPRLGELHNVPPKPSQFLERPHVFDQIRNKLLKSLQPGNTKTVGLIGAGAKIGVHGMGGVGKTILAAAIAQDEDIRRAFPDGIYWLTMGSDSGSDQIATRQRQLANSLDASSPGFKDIQGGKAILEELLRNKACLIILDDVWNPQHAAAFNVLGPKDRLLITTRIGAVLSGIEAETILVDVLSEDEAKELLAKWAGQPPEELPTSTFYVAKECGYLPLALSMIGAMIRMQQDKMTAWQDVLDQLKSRDLKDFRSHFPDYQYPHLLRAITVSLDDLGPEYKEHYLDFAIFPEDQAVLESVMLALWGKKRGMADYAVRDLLNQLVDRSLARRDEKGRIYLHDLQADYVRKAVSQESNGGLASRHNRLLEAYSTVCGATDWAKGPDDGYYFQWLPWHLRQAGRNEELHRLLWEPEWVSSQAALH